MIRDIGMIPAMIADLHCHSTASDGTLPPRELLTRARDRGVGTLAITDHDTVDAYAGLDCDDVVIVPGVELSAQWSGRTIHVVGLGIDLGSASLADAIGLQQQARIDRATVIAQRLEKQGIPDTLDGARRIAGNSQIGRPHFAQHLLNTGRARSIAAAFKRYLGAGKPGDVKSHWPELETAVGWLRAAGGIAVLAHPGKYRMTNAKLGDLAREFRDAGGEALEVLCGKQTPDLTRKLASLCNDLELHASCGSDFHEPDRPWSELGAFGRLPDGCRPVWNLF